MIKKEIKCLQCGNLQIVLVPDGMGVARTLPVDKESEVQDDYVIHVCSHGCGCSTIAVFAKIEEEDEELVSGFFPVYKAAEIMKDMTPPKLYRKIEKDEIKWKMIDDVKHVWVSNEEE